MANKHRQFRHRFMVGVPHRSSAMSVASGSRNGRRQSCSVHCPCPFLPFLPSFLPSLRSISNQSFTCGCAGIPLTGTSVNPARSLGPATVRRWRVPATGVLFLIAPFIGRGRRCSIGDHAVRPDAVLSDEGTEQLGREGD